VPSVQALKESFMTDTINNADQKLKRSLGPERQNSFPLCAQGTRELPGGDGSIEKGYCNFYKTQ